MKYFFYHSFLYALFPVFQTTWFFLYIITMAGFRQHWQNIELIHILLLLSKRSFFSIEIIVISSRAEKKQNYTVFILLPINRNMCTCICFYCHVLCDVTKWIEKSVHIVSSTLDKCNENCNGCYFAHTDDVSRYASKYIYAYGNWI